MSDSTDKRNVFNTTTLHTLYPEQAPCYFEPQEYTDFDGWYDIFRLDLI